MDTPIENPLPQMGDDSSLTVEQVRLLLSQAHDEHAAASYKIGHYARLLRIKLGLQSPL